MNKRNIMNKSEAAPVALKDGNDVADASDYAYNSTTYIFKISRARTSQLKDAQK